MQQKLKILAVACGAGAGNPATAQAPAALQAAGLVKQLAESGWQVDWEEIAVSLAQTPFGTVLAANKSLAMAAEAAVRANEPLLVLGGDHSLAAGSWSGVANAKGPGQVGLIWIDAHMDAHVPETTPSGNWHGMPVAHLLGEGLDALTALSRDGAALRPEWLCQIGIRSYEDGEAALLRRLGVRVFTMEEVQKRGLAAVWQEALAIVGQAAGGFGVSFDVDSIDPQEAPGVGTPEAGGLRAAEVKEILAGLAQRPDFVGLEVVELNPVADRAGATLALTLELIVAALGR